MTASTWHVPAPMSGDRTWTRLARLVQRRNVLLHGSRIPGLSILEPRAPVDFSLDGFSKATAVYATEDPTWAMAYAIRSAACRRFLNACFYPAAAADWRQRRIFLSYASVEGRAPTAPGVVYAVPREGFTRMPSYRDPGLGLITECQWINQEPVAVAAEIPVAPANLPIEPLLHDFEEVGLRSARDPHGFPWTG